MKKNLLYLCGAVLLGCFMMSCEKEDNSGDSNNPNSNVNWWYRANLAPFAGLKTVKGEGLIEKFDKQGRMTYLKYFNDEVSYDEYTFEYNSDNLVTKETYISQYEKRITTTTLYEYNNKGKFVPAEGWPFHLFEQGLSPDLSKISSTRTDGYMSTITFTFDQKGNLTIVSTSKYDDDEDDKIYNDTVYIEYKGAYPNAYEDKWDFLGPCTYQSNGMFDVYTEGFKNDAGEKRTIRHYYFRKDFKDAMLLDKYEDYEEWGSAVTTYEYDAKGNLLKEVETGADAEGTPYEYVTTFTYEFDSKGNPVSRTTKSPWNKEPYVETYEYEYY